MKKVLIALLAAASLQVTAQTEGSKTLFPELTADSVSRISPDQAPLPSDSLLPSIMFRKPAEGLKLNQNFTSYDRASNLSFAHQSVAPFHLWKGADVVISGYQDEMPGLMATSTGQLALRQRLGRFQITAVGMANKYWMPGQNTLYTHFGYGGLLSYQVNQSLALNAFGYYYHQNPVFAASMAPYLSTTSYGGYADIRFSDHFGSNVGVRRYVNPMSGHWTTEPIVTPYLKIGKSKMEFPIGNILKTLIWGDRDNPMRFRSPVTPPQQRK
jgi:hypothetical protein